MTHEQEAQIRNRVAAGLDLSTTDARVLLVEIDRLEGWGQNTMDGCLAILVKAQMAVNDVLEALGSGRGASDLMNELDEAVTQLSAGRYLMARPIEIGNALAGELQHLYTLSKEDQRKRLPKVMSLLDQWQAANVAATVGSSR